LSSVNEVPSNDPAPCQRCRTMAAAWPRARDNYLGARPMIPSIARRANKGWRGYFGHGHPRKSFDKLNWSVLERLRYNLHRRSQRRYRVPQGRTFYAHLVHDLGLHLL
jgi:hypothetical protein